MVDGISVRSDDYKRLMEKLKTTDKKVARAYRKRLREAAGPVGRYVIEFGSGKMPHRGGLSAYLQGHSPVAVSMRSTGADLWLGSKKKSQISLLNRGMLRHPVWADQDAPRSSWAWSTQSVPDEAFTEALEHLPEDIKQNLAKTVNDILKELDL